MKAFINPYFNGRKVVKSFIVNKSLVNNFLLLFLIIKTLIFFVLFNTS